MTLRMRSLHCANGPCPINVNLHFALTSVSTVRWRLTGGGWPGPDIAIARRSALGRDLWWPRRSGRARVRSYKKTTRDIWTPGRSALGRDPGGRGEAARPSALLQKDHAGYLDVW